MWRSQTLVTPSPRPFLFCLVPADRADTLLTPLREHFASQPQVAVLVEQRAPEGDQRRADPEVRGHARAPVAERDPQRALPPTLRPAARGLRFVQRMEPVGRTHEATDTSELLALSRAEDTGAVSELWWRFSGRVLARLRSRLGEAAAEAATAERGRISRARMISLTASLWLPIAERQRASQRWPMALSALSSTARRNSRSAHAQSRLKWSSTKPSEACASASSSSASIALSAARRALSHAPDGGGSAYQFRSE